jgi:hypothetical protein
MSEIHKVLKLNGKEIYLNREGKQICGHECEVFSRIVGYYRPVSLWNRGKKEEFRQRKMFNEKKAVKSQIGLFKSEHSHI